VKNVASCHVPAIAARPCGTFVGRVSLAEKMQAADTGQHGEACEAACAEKSPNGSQPHLAPSEAGLSSLTNSKALRHVFVRVEFDGTARDRAKRQPEGFSPALNRGAIMREGGALYCLRLIRVDITYQANHCGEAFSPEWASRMKAQRLIRCFDRQFQRPALQVSFGERAARVFGLPPNLQGGLTVAATSGFVVLPWSGGCAPMIGERGAERRSLGGAG
jgi:hypothetical protein